MASEFWSEIAIACCLVLVFEGIMPFLYPERWQLWVSRLARMDRRTLRIAGLISMLSGVLGLYLVR